MQISVYISVDIHSRCSERRRADHAISSSADRRVEGSKSPMFTIVLQVVRSAPDYRGIGQFSSGTTPRRRFRLRLASRAVYRDQSRSSSASLELPPRPGPLFNSLPAHGPGSSSRSRIVALIVFSLGMKKLWPKNIATPLTYVGVLHRRQVYANKI